MHAQVCVCVWVCVLHIVCECAVVPNHRRPVEVMRRWQSLFHGTLKGTGEREDNKPLRNYLPVAVFESNLREKEGKVRDGNR